MATIKDVLIRFLTDTKQLDKAEKDIKDLSKTEQTAAQKRDALIKSNIASIKRLEKARKAAFSTKDIESYNAAISQAKNRVKTLESAQETLGKKGSKLGSVFRGIGAQITGAFALHRIVSFTGEALKLGLELEGIEKGFSKLNQPGLLDNLRQATSGTVTDLELMRASVQAQNFKVPLERLASFFKFATLRASETGQSVQKLTNDIVLGIGRKSVKIIDNLGISAAEVREEFAKTGDFAEAVANIIEREMDGASEAILTNAQRWAQLQATVSNFMAKAGKEILDSVFFSFDLLSGKNVASIEAQFRRASQSVDGLAKSMKDWQERIDTLRSSEGELSDRQQDIIDDLLELIKLGEEHIKNLKDQNDKQEESVNTLKAWREELKLLKVELDGLEVGSKAFQNTLKRINNLQAKIKDATKDLSKELEAIRKDELGFEDKDRDEGDNMLDALIGLTDADIDRRDKELQDIVDAVEKVTKRQSDIVDKAAKDRDDKEKQQAQDTIDRAERTSRQILLFASVTDQIVSEIALRADIKDQESIERLNKKIDSRISSIREESEIQNELIEADVDNNIITKEEGELKKQQLDDETEANIVAAKTRTDNAIKALELRAARRNKKLALFDIAVNTASAIISQLAATPLPVGGPFVAAIAAQGILQSALVASRPLQGFKKGGYTGDLSTEKVAGITHGKEFVIDAAMTKKMGLKGKNMSDFGNMVENGDFSVMSRGKEAIKDSPYIYKGENIESAINSMRKQNAVNAKWTADKISKSIKEDKFIKSHTLGN